MQKQLGLADGGSSPLWALAVAANGRAAAGGLDRTVHVWEPDGTEIHSFANSVGMEAGIALSRDGNLLLTGGNEPMTLGRLQIGNDSVLRALSLKTLKPAIVGVHLTYVSCIALSPNGRQALTGSDCYVRIWDVANARDLRPAGLAGHTGRVWGVAFHPKANQAVSVAHDNTARVWDLAGGRSIRVIEGLPGLPHGVAYSPDGRAILVWGAGAVGVWDAVTGSPLLSAATVRDPIFANAEAACWVPDGKLVVGGSAGVALIDPTNGAPIHEFDSPPASIHSVGVSGDGRLVFAAGRGLACWEMISPTSGPR